MKKLATAMAVMAVALAAVPVAQAGGGKVQYKGKVKEGPAIQFFTQNGWIDGFRTSITTTCVSAQGGTPLVLNHIFWSQWKFRPGKSYAWDTTDGITRHYKFESSGKPGKRIAGKVSVSFSQLAGSSPSDYRILTCYGTANFKLAPLHR